MNNYVYQLDDKKFTYTGESLGGLQWPELNLT